MHLLVHGTLRILPGMVFSTDYVFSWGNFIGLNISVVASILYTVGAFKGGSAKVKKTESKKIKETKA